MKVTFIGLGIMGSRMAHNLLKNNVDLTVYNRSKEPVSKLLSEGAKTTDTLKEAVAVADIVFTMLSTPEVVESLFLAEDGALSAMKKGAIWCDCSTVNPSFSKRSAIYAEDNNIRFADTPVAGTKPHAQNAELVFFVGADQEVFDEITPLLGYMGKKTMHIGALAMGASFKMLVNAMLAQSMIVFSETILLGEKMGLDKEFLLNVLPNLVVSAPFTKFKAEMIKSEDYTVQFPLEWMHKDLHLAALTAYEHDQPMYLVNMAKEIFAEAKKSGLGRMDFAAVHQYLEKR